MQAGVLCLLFAGFVLSLLTNNPIAFSLAGSYCTFGEGGRESLVFSAYLVRSSPSPRSWLRLHAGEEGGSRAEGEALGFPSGWSDAAPGSRIGRPGVDFSMYGELAALAAGLALGAGGDQSARRRLLLARPPAGLRLPEDAAWQSSRRQRRLQPQPRLHGAPAASLGRLQAALPDRCALKPGAQADPEGKLAGQEAGRQGARDGECSRGLEPSPMRVHSEVSPIIVMGPTLG